MATFLLASLANTLILLPAPYGLAGIALLVLLAGMNATQLARAAQSRFQASLDQIGRLMAWLIAPAIVMDQPFIRLTNIGLLHDLLLNGPSPTTEQWIPIETKRDMILLQHVTAARRRFLKPMRFNLGRSIILPSLLLTDAGPDPVRLYLDDPNREADLGEDDSEPASMPAPAAPAKQSMEITDTWPLWLWSDGADPPDLPPVHRIPHRT